MQQERLRSAANISVRRQVFLPGYVAPHARTPVEAFLASYSFSLALAVPQVTSLRDATSEHK